MKVPNQAIVWEEQEQSETYSDFMVRQKANWRRSFKISQLTQSTTYCTHLAKSLQKPSFSPNNVIADTKQAMITGLLIGF